MKRLFRSGYNRHTAAKLLKRLWVVCSVVVLLDWAYEGLIERRGGHGPGFGYEWRRR